MSNFTEGSQPIEERKQITLLKPETEGAINKYTVDAETDIVLGFETGAATMSKSDDGSDLVFTFTDANNNIIATIIIEDFYDIYSADELPTFLISDGTGFMELAAEDLFLGNSELLPAAGNESQQANDHSGSDPIDPELLSGLGEGLSALERRSNPTQPSQASDPNSADLSDDDSGGDDSGGGNFGGGNSGGDDSGGGNSGGDDSGGGNSGGGNSGGDDSGGASDLPVADVFVADDSNIPSGKDGKIVNIESDSDGNNFAQRAFDDYSNIFGTNHDYGDDGAATNNSLVTSYALSFREDIGEILTNITVGKGKNKEDIYLYAEEDGSFVGRPRGEDTVYFKLFVDENGQFIVTEYLPTNGGTINITDDTVILTRTDTITDGNGDTNSDSASIEIELKDITIRKNPLDYDDIIGKNNTGYTVDDQSAANLLITEKIVTNIDISTENGKDFVKIVTEDSAGLRAQGGQENKIFMNKDDDTLIIDAGTHAMRADENSSNTINTGQNEDMVTLTADKNAMLANGGENTVDTGKHSDTIDITAGSNAMYAIAGGENTINAGEAKDSVTIKADGFAMWAKNTNSQNIINLEDGADELYIEGDLRAVDGGKNIISGGKNDDFIFIKGDFFGQGNEIYGGQDDDLIKLEASDLKFGDVLTVHGGDNTSDKTDDMDILLTGLDNLNAVKGGLTAGAINGIEIAIAGNVEGESVKEVLAELGLDKNEDGKIETAELQGWTPDGPATKYNGQEYQEYTKGLGEDQVTILIQTDSIV